MKKKFRLISAIVAAAMLMTMSVGIILAGAVAGTDIVVSVTTGEPSGLHRGTDLVLTKEIATDADSFVSKCGELITINGVLLKDALKYRPSHGYPAVMVAIDSTNSKKIIIYTDTTSWRQDVEGYSHLAMNPLGVIDGWNAEIKLLEGLPFSDDTTLDRTITLTRASDQTSWTIDDPGPKPVIPTYPSTELTDVTVTGQQNDELIPEEAGKHDEWYYATVLTFNKELPSMDKTELLRLFGDTLVVNSVPLTKASAYVNPGGGGTPAVIIKAGEDNKSLIVYTDRWSWVGNILQNSSNLTIGTRPEQDNTIELLKGFQFKDGVLDKDVKLVLSQNATKWGIDDPNAEPDLDGVKVLVNMTNGEGGPGISDAVSGQTWQSITKIVFDQPLTAEDTSEEAVVKKFGPYIILNSKTVDELYKSNNPQTGVPHAVTMTLSADRKTLTVYCDVSMTGALTSSQDQFVLLSKDFPITSKKTLEREVAFEYSPEIGDWALIDPYTEDDLGTGDPGNKDPGNNDPDNNEPNDTPNQDEPADTGVPFVGTGIVLAVLAAGTAVLTYKKRKA